ncbi:MAG: transglutaminaseTgpA domain-containing protein [bacterium]|nr:transglutaminaseTgpA domain-containing protein [bacterium]
MEETKRLTPFQLIENSLIIAFMVFSIYPSFRNFELIIPGYLVLIVFISIFILQPKITIPDNFIKNYTIGIGIISFVLYLLFDSLREKDEIRDYAFIIYFFMGFTVFAGIIHVFKSKENKHKRILLGYLTLLLFWGASYRNSEYAFLPILAVALGILSIILVFEIIYIFRMENPVLRIPVFYYLVIIPVIGASLIFAVFFITFIPDLVKFFDKNVISSMPRISGFSNISRIGDIKNIKLSRKIIMRIYGDAPFYMRGNVYENLRINKNLYDWEARNNFEVLEKSNNSEFILRPGDGENIVKRYNSTVFLKLPSGTKEPELFLPENPIKLINEEVDNIKYDNNREVARLTKFGYLIQYSCEFTTTERFKELPDDSHLAVPDYIKQNFSELALNIRGDAEKDFQKVQNLSDFFKNNDFKYSLSIDLKQGRDPILYFLTESKTGYCEYYATAAVILLRLMGVRARYLSGFIVSEESPDKEFFVVRALHAHAWVEYFDTEQGVWETYDPTSYAMGFEPNEGYEPSAFERFFELILFQRDRLRNTVSKLSMDEIRYQLQKLISDFTFNMILLGLVILYVVLRLVFGKDKLQFNLFKKYAKEKKVILPDEKEWNKIISKIEEILSKTGTKRDVSETIKEYLNRIDKTKISPELLQKITEVIEQYYLFKYRGESVSSEMIYQELKSK